MAATYTLIASNTLSSSAASVTFSSIPGTYTDLVLRFSIRGDSATNFYSLMYRYNNSSTSDYSYTYLNGSGSTASSSRANGWTEHFAGYVNGSTSTSNTFASGEIYIPNYAGSTNKVSSVYLAGENNNTSSWQMGTIAALRNNTAAINEIRLNITNIVSGSSFFLYGIKNS